jgi:indole-3-glycerol phosphate synthase
VTFLEEIINNRRVLLDEEKKLSSMEETAKKAIDLFESGYRPVDFLNTYNSETPFLIAEIKKSSPSKGLIRKEFILEEIINSYKSSGHVNAISVLTEPEYFSGSYDYLSSASKTAGKPVLMKDFIFEEYQIFKGFLSGASAILLIAAILNDDQLKSLSGLAHKLNMRVLFEVHTANEYRRALKYNFGLIGINNRDLKTFKTDINTTISILEKEGRPDSGIIISESGIDSKEKIHLLRNIGTDGFLVGEQFMKHSNINSAITDLFK